jgi:flagellar basal body-associated protein FliL
LKLHSLIFQTCSTEIIESRNEIKRTGENSPSIPSHYAKAINDLSEFRKEAASPSRNQNSPDYLDDLKTTDKDNSFPSDSDSSAIRDKKFQFPRPNTPKSSKNSSTFIFLGVVISIIIAVVIGSTFYHKSKDTEPIEKVLCLQFLDLSNDFPNQNEKLFKMLKSGVESVRNDGDVLVFSLFSTDEKLMSNFVDKVVKLTQSCLNNTMDPIKLNENEIDEEMIENYKEKLEDSSIMVLNNIDKAEVGHVSVLHSFFDAYNPVVKPLAIFITIQVSSSPSGKEIDFIQEHLRNRWQGLKSNVRDPLITRILDQTYYLKPQ